MSKRIEALDSDLFKHGIDNQVIANLIPQPNKIDNKLADNVYVDKRDGTVAQLKP